VAVTDAHSGQDVLLLPLVRRPTGRLRSIEFADLWAADYNAPVIGHGAPSSADECQTLWNEVVSALPQADIVRFTKMPFEVRGVPNPLARLRGTRPSDMRGHVVHLPDRWEDYIQSLNSSVRKAFRRRWRRFQERNNAHLFCVEDARDAQRVLEVLRAQQSSRLDALGTRHIFDQRDYVRFYKQYVTQGVANGTAVLTALVVGNKIVATFLAVADGYSCVLIRSSQLWDDEWASIGLGKLIIERTMELLHQRGHRSFDLSIGNFAYKLDFRVQSIPLCDYHQTRTLRAIPAACRERTWDIIQKYPRIANSIRSARHLAFSASGGNVGVWSKRKGPIPER
jgi:CelD/BcsL family acetyltransferase involved in cellulose biosynthesis